MNLNKDVTLQIKPFLRWWGRELAFLVPRNVRQFFYTPPRAIIVLPSQDTLTLVYETEGKQETLITLPQSDLSPTALEGILDNTRFKNALVVLRLSSEDALCKTLTLPMVAQHNLTQVVSYELDRYTPFNANQVYFATHITQIDTSNAQLTVQLLLTPKKILETYYAQCQSLGLSVHTVDIAAYPNSLDEMNQGYTLLPAPLQTQRTNTPRRMMLILCLLLGLLSTASLILPIWLEYQSINTLQQRIANIEKEAKAVKALQADIETLNEENQQLIAEKTAMPPLVAVLNELSALMHDDSWLAYLQYGDGQLQLQGESPAASNLLADLEASDYFAKVSFASPVTQDKASGVERFQIAAEVTKPATPKTDDTSNNDAESSNESERNATQVLLPDSAITNEETNEHGQANE